MAGRAKPWLRPPDNLKRLLPHRCEGPWACSLPFLVVASCLAAGGAAASEPRGQLPKSLFTTSIQGSGNLATWPEAGGSTGLAAADKVCRARATAAGLANAQTFVAWMSDAADDAYCRAHGFGGKVADKCGQPTLPNDAGPWVRTDGHLFADDVLALVFGRVRVPPTLDEYGNPLVVTGPAGSEVFSGTDPGGVVDGGGRTCMNWTSAQGTDQGAAGSWNATFTAWFTYFSAFCSFERHLVCLEPGAGPAVEMPTTQGALMFYSGSRRSNGAIASGGLTGADAFCRLAAEEAALPAPASFRAYLSDGTTHAPDRMTHPGPWIRPDGVLVATSVADLTDGTLAAPINVDPYGDYWGQEFFSTPFAWTGTDPAGVGTADHCAGWSTDQSDVAGLVGRPEFAGPLWTQDHNGLEPQAMGCGVSVGLYCFSQVTHVDGLLFGDGFEDVAAR